MRETLPGIPDQIAVNARPLVIGVGARFRGDDEAGLLAVEALQSEQADFALHSDDPARLMSDWIERSNVIVIDAVRTGEPAGTLHRFDVNETGLVPRSRTSSHGDALTDAIELSRALGSLPKTLVILGIEPGRTGLGEEMSQECLDALPALIEMARKEISCMSRR